MQTYLWDANNYNEFQLKTYPFISFLVIFCHSLIFGFCGWFNVGPFLSQLLGNVTNTIFRIQSLDFCALIIAEPEERWPGKWLTQMFNMLFILYYTRRAIIRPLLYFRYKYISWKIRADSILYIRCLLRYNNVWVKMTLTMTVLEHLGPWPASSSFRVQQQLPWVAHNFAFLDHIGLCPFQPSHEISSSLCPTLSASETKSY